MALQGIDTVVWGCDTKEQIEIRVQVYIGTAAEVDTRVVVEVEVEAEAEVRTLVDLDVHIVVEAGCISVIDNQVDYILVLDNRADYTVAEARILVEVGLVEVGQGYRLRQPEQINFKKLISLIFKSNFHKEIKLRQKITKT